jgi:hypothetical protein
MAEPEAELWVGSRKITAEDIELIRWTVRRFGALSRTELAETLCENLAWKAPNGRPKIAACVGLLQRLAGAGEIALPTPRRRPEATAGVDRRGTAPPSPVVHSTLAALRPVRVDPVPADEGPTWNAMMAEYHPLGFRRAFGAHQKYWVHDEATGRPRVLGGLLFAAAAKALAVRDAWIGWSAAERRRGLHRIVANSRYLLLPEVGVPHLASHVLALALRRLRGDWVRRYGFAPSVVETFVARPWAGTCYRAANWQYLGETAGRGRQDRVHAKAVPIKAVWVYPLGPDWRARLVAAPEVAPDGQLDA